MRLLDMKFAMPLAALLALAACDSNGQERGKVLPDKPAAAMPDYRGAEKPTTAPPKAPSADAAAPTGEPSKDKDEKRGNTPPGKDRSGGGPLDGAIVDPAGVTQK
jgi:hypothetical protein